jgi:hypothetical protein
MIPQVVTYRLVAGTGTTIATTQTVTTLSLGLNGTTIIGPPQRRIIITSTGDDSAIFFRVIGLNQANNTVTELLAGGNATTVATSSLDYVRVISITPSTATGSLATTAATTSVGVSQAGSSLWNYVNQHATPVNIELSVVIVPTIPVTNSTWSIQYTYDDPSNLPAGISFPQPFNHPTLVNTSVSLDGPINDPITAWRLTSISGTGTLRATSIQAGI